MREYDILFIIKARLEEKQYESIINEFKTIITKNSGEVLLLSPIGMRDLPKTFDRHESGYFVHAQFKSNSETLDQLRHYFKVNENIVRDLIVTLDSVRMPKIERQERPERSERPDRSERQDRSERYEKHQVKG